MGLVIDSSENEQGVDVEIRRESIIIYGDSSDNFVTDNETEVGKDYLRRLIGFFTEHPEHLRDA